MCTNFIHDQKGLEIEPELYFKCNSSFIREKGVESNYACKVTKWESCYFRTAVI